MKYKIGQVLYILLNREMKICPVQVVEEITKRTIDGESTSYIVKTGKNKETVALSDIGGQVFESMDTLRQTLIERITKSIDSIVASTLQKADEWYPRHVIQQQEKPREEIYHDNVEVIEPLQESINIEDAIVTLPDGTVAKVKMSV